MEFFSGFEDNIRFALPYTPLIACLESKSKFVKSTEGKQQMLQATYSIYRIRVHVAVFLE